jgi:hypothetical protein
MICHLLITPTPRFYAVAAAAAAAPLPPRRRAAQPLYSKYVYVKCM